MRKLPGILPYLTNCAGARLDRILVINNPLERKDRAHMVQEVSISSRVRPFVSGTILAEKNKAATHAAA